MQTFNINNYVFVKLTPKGYAIHREHWLPFAGDKYMPPSRDSGGYTKFQLWDLMQVFGTSIYNGCVMPFETEIVLDIKGSICSNC
jgi:hypothetical protein